MSVMAPPLAGEVPAAAGGDDKQHALASNGASNVSSDIKALLGTAGQGTLPVWLKPELFLAPEFDPEACVADLRRFAPLTTLQSELQAYLATLKAKMVEVINEDYQDYVNLSAKLVNVDGAVVRMRKPLLELKEKLSVMSEAVRSELQALAAGLRRRKEVAMARSLLELMQELAHVASKVEKLLEEVLSEDATSSSLETRAMLLERVAGEVSRLTFQANRGKDLAFVRSMEPRITSTRKQLQDVLERAFTSALEHQEAPSILHCMHAYAELGLTEPPEAALRTKVVSPIIIQLIKDHKSHHSARTAAVAAAGGRDDGLSQLLNKIDASVSTQLGPLLTACLTPQSPLRAFDLLGNVLLAEVDAQLIAQLPAVFSPGVPPAFHANYQAAQAFLEQIESKCRSRSSLDRLRASGAYTTFVKRWNTSVYMSLLYQEVAGELEDAANLGRPDFASLPPSSTPGPLLPLTKALLHGLSRTASPQTYLPVLADRFLKLALQLGQRYISWCSAACSARAAGAQAAAQGPTLPGGAAALAAASAASQHNRTGSVSGTGDDGSTGGAAGVGGGTAGTGPGGGGGSGGDASGGAGNAADMSWVAACTLDDLSLLYSDIVAAAQHIREHHVTTMCQLLSAVPDTALEALKAGLLEQADAIHAQGASLLCLMADEVVEACVGVVRQLKGITATYRMTTKGPPSRHSHYVPSVLAPLKSLLDGPRMSHMSKEAQLQIVKNVVDAVTGRYQVLAEELLNTVRKTESSLKRLKKVQQADAGDAAAMSDSDKITLQLYLDVQEYGQQVARFGVAAAGMPSFVKLLESVTPAAHVLASVAAPAPAAKAD